jgi:uncharacterized SAM-binding protein YcdF (DUF218 family)
MRRLLRRAGGALAWLVPALLLTGLFVASFERLAASLSHPPGTLYATEGTRPGPAPLVVVLGSGLRSETELERRSSARLETAVRLRAEGRVERLHFTGASSGTVSVAEVMRDYAVARGVPPDAITIETESRTTLQNAMFTLREIGPLPPGTLVLTDGVHLPRAWASFVWAGSGTDIVLVPSDRLPDETLARYLSFVARETLAIWLNVGRVLVASVLVLAGIDLEDSRLLDRMPVGWLLPT